jgi:hypothetical protein
MNAHPIIDHVLEEKRDVLHGDYAMYRNHVYRVFYLSLAIEGNASNADKYAIAAVFHDIGIWTHRTFDYLIPSIQEATLFLNQHQQQTWKDEVSCMIDMHHKIKAYKGSYGTVEIFREADWMDVTMGALHFNLQKKEIASIKKAYPTLGFHRFLLKQTIRNFFRHPLNPLPMFKR